MKTFSIIEFDNDYRTITGYLSKEFESLEEADKWCKKKDWSGYSYYVDRKRMVEEGY